jgi:hypothetical protein
MSDIIEIADFFSPELDVYARLSEVQLLNNEFPEKGMFIAESPKVIDRALDAGCVPLSVLVEDRHVDGEAKEVLARCGEQVRQYRDGNKKVVGFLVGQCMRASHGTGNPKLFNQLLRQRLDG